MSFFWFCAFPCGAFDRIPGLPFPFASESLCLLCREAQPERIAQYPIALLPKILLEHVRADNARDMRPRVTEPVCELLMRRDRQLGKQRCREALVHLAESSDLCEPPV